MIGCGYLLPLLLATTVGAAPARYEGRWFAGRGDTDYLTLLNTSYQMLYPSAELQNLGMLYNSSWHGLVEGPTWGAWWIQNSYGPSYCGLPFFTEPYSTWLANSQDLWFSQMGDGHREGGGNWHWVAPDGCLCDAAAPGWIFYKQGDGNIKIHDWGMEFTAAGVVLQAELLLVSRDRAALDHYLPLLERCANFLETRRDPANNLFLAGPAGNLLAPSYAGWKKPDGTYGQAYLTGLSITTIAALDRLIELEKLAGRTAQATLYTQRRDAARQGLTRLLAPGGDYYIKYLDPDGTAHGVLGAARHNYFEAVCNHDAIAFRVADDEQSRRIYRTLAGVPGLRPHDVVLTNSPGLDDLYVEPRGLWEFGRWVNGGHWTTCEARMLLAYARLGQYEDMRRSLRQLLSFARQFRFDNPLVDCGAAVYQPQQPVNCVYDSWGGPLGLLRGLFEYLYRADSLTLVPHVPPGITELDQRFPIRFGQRRLWLATRGTGPITQVLVNGQPWPQHDATSVTLPYDQTPDQARVVICCGGAAPTAGPPVARAVFVAPPPDDALWQVATWFRNPLGNGHPLRLGADSQRGSKFVGDFRRVRLYDQALTAAQVASLAAEPLGLATPSPVLDLRFDQAAAESLAKPQGELTFVAADGGQVARFGGQGWLEVPPEARLTLHDHYTLEAYVKPAAGLTGPVRLLDRVTAGVDDGYLLDIWPGGGVRFISEQGHLTGPGWQPAVWNHLVATFDGGAGLRLYVNGREVAHGPIVVPNEQQLLARVGAFHTAASAAGLGESWEVQQAQLAIQQLQALRQRVERQQAGELQLPEPTHTAANRSYLEAADRLARGLAALLATYAKSAGPRERQLAALWQASGR